MLIPNNNIDYEIFQIFVKAGISINHNSCNFDTGEIEEYSVGCLEEIIRGASQCGAL